MSVFPLSIAIKEDSPARLLALANVPEKNKILAADINIIVAALKEVEGRGKYLDDGTGRKWWTRKGDGNVDNGNLQPADIIAGYRDGTKASYVIAEVLTVPINLDNAETVKILFDSAASGGGGTGPKGDDGDSAYQVALNNGFVGTQGEWLASLIGATGSPGADGADGTDGISAYQVALNNGFVGTEVEWLASLKGADGADGADASSTPPSDAGSFTGSLALNNLNGTYFSDYDLAVDGPITFSISGTPVNFGIAYVRIVSDGTTPFAVESNLNAIFNAQYGIPEDYILPSGTYEVYFLKTPSGATINIPGTSGSAVLLDVPPIAYGVAFTGARVVGELLTGSYVYSDSDSDLEDGTTFKWYRADDGSGTGEIAISGATSQDYTLQASDEGKYIRLGVTPANAIATGIEAFSSYSVAIEEEATSDTAPVASVVSFTGTETVGEELKGTYTYYDSDSDLEDGTTFKWYRADDGSGTGEAAISGATSQDYTLQAADEGKYIRLGVTPANSIATGIEAFSSYSSEIAAAVEDDLPYFSDSQLYINTLLDTPSVSGTAVTRILNRVDASNSPENTGSYQPFYDDIKGCITFESINDILTFPDDVFLTRDSFTVTYYAQFNAIGSDASAKIYLSKPSEASSVRDGSISPAANGQGFTVAGFGTTLFITDSGAATDRFLGKGFISLTHDSAVNKMVAYFDLPGFNNMSTSGNRVDGSDTTLNLNRIEFRSGIGTFDLYALDIKNRNLTKAEIIEIHDYLKTL